MTTRYYRPAVKTDNGAGSLVFLPVPIMTWIEEPTVRNEMMEVPLVGGATLLAQTAGVRRIEIRGRIWGAQWDAGTSRFLLDSDLASMSNALAIRQALEAAMAGRFWLYRWNTEHFENCFLADGSGVRVQETDKWHVPVLEWSASILAGDPDVKTTSPISGAGWWESFVGGGQTEEETATIMEDYYTLTFEFPGLAVAETADTELRATLAGPSGGSVSVVGVEIVRTSGNGLGGATGSTSVTASLSSLGSGLTATVESDEIRSGLTEGTLSALAGDTLYVHRSLGSGGGGHTDVAVQVHCKRG